MNLLFIHRSKNIKCFFKTQLLTRGQKSKIIPPPWSPIAVQSCPSLQSGIKEEMFPTIPVTLVHLRISNSCNKKKIVKRKREKNHN